MTDAVAAVQNAAVDGALASPADARRRFALAGALEAARHAGDGSPVLSALGALHAIDCLDVDPGRTDPWTPDRDALAGCVVTGAALAVERFDRDVAAVADAAGVSTAALRAELDGR